MVSYRSATAPAVDPTDTVNATEPANAKALYRNQSVYVLRLVAATIAVQNDGFILPSDALMLAFKALGSDVAK